ncbi:MAG: pyridoxal phosphate-dependent aminotransferase [Bacteroidota bacterium]
MTETKYIRPNTSLIAFFSNKVKHNGGINFAQGLPGFAPPKELLEILKEKTKENVHQYAPSNGDLKLSNLLLQKYNSKYKTNFDASNTLITNGATEAISLAFIYLWNKYGDMLNVLSMNPVYESYSNLPRIYHCKHFVYNYSDNNSVDIDLLENQIKENAIKLIFIGTPGNPMGKIWNKTDFDKLVELSRKYQFYIIIDAVYNELYFNEETYLPLNNLADNIFYVNSFSKSLSITGWRVGYLICETEIMKKIRNIHDYTALSSSHPLQSCIAEFLEKYDFGKTYISETRERIKQSHERISKSLLKLGFEIPPIDGGYFIWTKLPKQFTDGFRFAIDLYDEKKVSIVPGIHFNENANDFIRINVARLDEEIEEGIKGINEYFNGIYNKHE